MYGFGPYRRYDKQTTTAPGYRTESRALASSFAPDSRRTSTYANSADSDDRLEDLINYSGISVLLFCINAEWEGYPARKGCNGGPPNLPCKTTYCCVLLLLILSYYFTNCCTTACCTRVPQEQNACRQIQIKHTRCPSFPSRSCAPRFKRIMVSSRFTGRIMPACGCVRSQQREGVLHLIVYVCIAVLRFEGRLNNPCTPFLLPTPPNDCFYAFVCVW